MLGRSHSTMTSASDSSAATNTGVARSRGAKNATRKMPRIVP